MKKILFDVSTHLGQFSSNDDIRRGCKNMQASISERPEASCVGVWTDLENARADQTIWKLPRDVQDDFYPLMDRFFSVMNIKQPAFSSAEEECSASLRQFLPSLTLYSRYTCARAIAMEAVGIHTLFEELLMERVKSYMFAAHGIRLSKPEAQKEHLYMNVTLEKCYQKALETFRAFEIDPLNVLADERTLTLL